jgi:hypothetical protein
MAGPLRRELCDLSSLTREDGVRKDQERARPLSGHRREGAVDVPGTPGREDLKPQPQDPSRSLRLSQVGGARWIVRMPKEGHPRDLGEHLLEHL